ncbi:hypothetical protein LCGC14_3084440, partial [marine sediment metagenome]
MPAVSYGEAGDEAFPTMPASVPPMGEPVGEMKEDGKEV